MLHVDPGIFLPVKFPQIFPGQISPFQLGVTAHGLLKLRLALSRLCPISLKFDHATAETRYTSNVYGQKVKGQGHSVT